MGQQFSVRGQRFRKKGDQLDVCVCVYIYIYNYIYICTQYSQVRVKNLGNYQVQGSPVVTPTLYWECSAAWNSAPHPSPKVTPKVSANANATQT